MGVLPFRCLRYCGEFKCSITIGLVETLTYTTPLLATLLSAPKNKWRGKGLLAVDTFVVSYYLRWAWQIMPMSKNDHLRLSWARPCPLLWITPCVKSLTLRDDGALLHTSVCHKTSNLLPAWARQRPARECFCLCINGRERSVVKGWVMRSLYYSCSAQSRHTKDHII